MKTILTYNKEPIFVDDEDYVWLNQFGWCLDPKGYVVRHNGTGTEYMHRVIGELYGLLKEETHHINKNKADNQKTNLLFLSNKDHNAMEPPHNQANRYSKYKGVTFVKLRNTWTASIRINGKTKHLGTFRSEEHAAKAYDAASREHYGTIAYQNFPTS